MNSNVPDMKCNSGIFEVDIRYSDLNIDPEQIIAVLGYPEGKINPHFLEIIEEALDAAQRLSEIKAGYGILDFNGYDTTTGSIIIQGKKFKTDKIVTGQFEKAEQAAVFICTIGSTMGKWIKHLSDKGDPVKSYIADIAASTVTEAAADYLHDHIGSEMKSIGLNITNRYSPGYCNWSVAEQQILFSLLPKFFCGVALTDSSLMVPIKSVSGIIGIGKNVRYKEYMCDSCGIKDCTYRSIRKRESAKRRVKN